MIDRLSLAMITGTGDFNRGEVERFRGPMLSDVGVRTKVTVVEKLGHGIPDSKTFADGLDDKAVYVAIAVPSDKARSADLRPI